MFRWLESRIFWGGLLVLGGVVFLLQNLGILALGDLFWALLFGLGGAFFVAVFFQNRQNWWALIPGFVLLSVAALIVVERSLPQFNAVLGGSIVLAGVGLSFLAIFLADAEHWWAVIPGGTLLSLAAVTAIGRAYPVVDTVGLFLLGMGFTFALLGLLPRKDGLLRWAWWPAGVLIASAALVLASARSLLNFVWPAALILAGGYLVMRTLTPRTN
jgi:hypothetical protein